MARGLVRRLLERGLGAPGRALLAWRTRGQADALVRSRGLADATAAIAAQLEHRVRRGPFAGMEYPRRRGDIVHAAKLLGAYEREIHDAVERLVARAPRLVVNVGSGDGYYSVGFARRLPSARVVAVDPDPLAQRAAAATARANGVADRIEPRTLVDAPALEALLARAVGRALVIVDCEGFEDDLLDPVRAPSLATTDLLVETHDFARPGVTVRLTARFDPTHDVEAIAIASRDPRSFSELAALPADAALGALDEYRHVPQSWLVLTAHASR